MSTALLPRAEPASTRGSFDRLLSNLSHELCRPLVSLRAGFDLLLGDACGLGDCASSAAIC